VQGTSGAVANLLAFPTFCIVVILAGLIGNGLRWRNLPLLASVLMIKLVLLTAGAVLAMRLGPFANGNGDPSTSAFVQSGVNRTPGVADLPW
jgi:hypothetical protein